MHWQDDEIVPDLVEPIVACRAWEPTRDTPWQDRKDGLGSIGVPYVWHAGVNIARCIRRGGWLGDEKCVRSPTPGCLCGFWGLTGWDLLHLYLSPPRWIFSPPVVGTVEMWGRVIPGEHGWRSQYARITSVTDERVAERLGVEFLADPDQVRLSSPWRPPPPRPRRSVRWFGGR